MTWISGRMDPVPGGGTEWVSTGSEPEPVRITDADVRADELERAELGDG